MTSYLFRDIEFCGRSLLARRQKAKKGPEREVEYVQTFIADYWSFLSFVESAQNFPDIVHILWIIQTY